MIVCKFGGTATANIKALKNIKKLAKNKDRKIFVFSAIGKENTKDTKLTDLFIDYTNCKNTLKKQEIIEKISKKLKNLCILLKIDVNIDKLLNNIIKQYNINNDNNFLISRGEYLTSFILSKYLGVKFVPAEKLIFFENNKINYKKIKQKLFYYLNKYFKIVVPGFYYVDLNKKIKLFSRGGSDITGAILACCFNKTIYENWTDINGIKPINPNIKKSKSICKMSYKNLEVMTNFDAKVIHNNCVKVLKNTNIILVVKNVFNLKFKGTKVFKNCKKDTKFVCYKIYENVVKIFVNNKNKTQSFVYANTNNYKNIMQNLI